MKLITEVNNNIRQQKKGLIIALFIVLIVSVETTSPIPGPPNLIGQGLPPPHKSPFNPRS